MNADEVAAVLIREADWLDRAARNAPAHGYTPEQIQGFKWAAGWVRRHAETGGPTNPVQAGAAVAERQRCICPDGLCLDDCRACNYSGRDLEETCIADPDWEPDDDDLTRRMGGAL